MNTQNIKCTKRASGFSLIELMVVIAIVAILSAVAIPSYRSYNAKARFTEATTLIGRQMDAFAERLTLGQSNVSLTLPTPAGMTSLVTNAGGTAIVATWPALAIDPTQETAMVATYTAVENSGGTVSWTCGTAATGSETAGIRTTLRSTYFTNPVCTGT